MEIKTSELSGAALDWATGKAAGVAVAHQPEGPVYVAGPGVDWQPSKDWSQGGPLIERYEVAVSPEQFGWEAAVYDGGHINPVDAQGSTALIAACRAIVAYKLGGTVTVPNELEV